MQLIWQSSFTMERQRQGIAREIHRPARKIFPRRRFVVKVLHDYMQTDLVDMSNYSRQNKGYKGILMVWNMFLKQVFVEPLKSKTGAEVTEAFERILRRTTPPKNLQSDKGLEYYNSNFSKLMS